MICEDEPDLLDLYYRALRSKYNVLTVTSGYECIERYVQHNGQGNKIDVLLIDYRLEDILGDEVACKIKDMDGTKAVMISAYEPEPALVDMLKEKNCIVEWFKKPMSVAVLLLKLESVLR
jgi:CheY-like chemotaxis protein